MQGPTVSLLKILRFLLSTILNLTAASNVVSSNIQYLFYDELYKLSNLTVDGLCLLSRSHA